MFDIIGDIHGHADELTELLSVLGYSEQHGVYRHPTRRVFFCGDFIDRGPHIPDVVRIARSMVENDSALAVMGNHEFNALAYHTENPAQPGEFLRPHTERNQFLHARTLEQFDESGLQSALEWFGSLPVAADMGSFRVVHACWSPSQIELLQTVAAEYGSAWTAGFLVPASATDDPVYDAVECVLKGPELTLPEGLSVQDKEGNTRRRIRIRWFEEAAEHTWATYSLPVRGQLPEVSVPADSPAVPYPSDAPPVFVGHYWLPESEPVPLASNVACLDYSVAKDGMLAAYRFDGESTLSADRFVTVPARPS